MKALVRKADYEVFNLCVLAAWGLGGEKTCAGAVFDPGTRVQPGYTQECDCFPGEGTCRTEGRSRGEAQPAPDVIGELGGPEQGSLSCSQEREVPVEKGC